MLSVEMWQLRVCEQAEKRKKQENFWDYYQQHCEEKISLLQLNSVSFDQLMNECLLCGEREMS